MKRVTSNLSTFHLCSRMQDLGRELMWDHVHANPEGDDLIAECYSKHLLATWEIE